MQSSSASIHGKRKHTEDLFTPRKKALVKPFNLFKKLPDEISLIIFQSLEKPSNFYKASLVCRKWKNILEENSLWGNLFFQHFGQNHTPSDNHLFKDQFKLAYLEEKRKILLYYPDWILSSFENVNKIIFLPNIKGVGRDYLSLLQYGLSDECKEPITRIIFEDGLSGLLIRYINRNYSPTEKICDLYYMVKPTLTTFKWKFFDEEKFDNIPINAHILPKFFHDPTFDKGEFLKHYFSRLIRKMPCGHVSGWCSLLAEELPITEGESTVYLA